MFQGPNFFLSLSLSQLKNSNKWFLENPDRDVIDSILSKETQPRFEEASRKLEQTLTKRSVT